MHDDDSDAGDDDTMVMLMRVVMVMVCVRGYSQVYFGDDVDGLRSAC